jgi:hypothetical protein
LRRFRQGSGEFPLRRSTHARWTAGTMFVQHALDAAPVGSSNPVDNGLSADAEKPADRS